MVMLITAGSTNPPDDAVSVAILAEAASKEFVPALATPELFMVDPMVDPTTE